MISTPRRRTWCLGRAAERRWPQDRYAHGARGVRGGANRLLPLPETEPTTEERVGGQGRQDALAEPPARSCALVALDRMLSV